MDDIRPTKNASAPAVAAWTLLGSAQRDTTEEVLAAAQAEATLAVAHELRTANLIAVANSTADALDLAAKMTYEAVSRGELGQEQAEALIGKIDEKRERLIPIQKTVRERLGLPE